LLLRRPLRQTDQSTHLLRAPSGSIATASISVANPCKQSMWRHQQKSIAKPKVPPSSSSLPSLPAPFSYKRGRHRYGVGARMYMAVHYPWYRALSIGMEGRGTWHSSWARRWIPQSSRHTVQRPGTKTDLGRHLPAAELGAGLPEGATQQRLGMLSQRLAWQSLQGKGEACSGCPTWTPRRQPARPVQRACHKAMMDLAGTV